MTSTNESVAMEVDGIKQQTMEVDGTKQQSCPTKKMRLDVITISITVITIYTCYSITSRIGGKD